MINLNNCEFGDKLRLTWSRFWARESRIIDLNQCVFGDKLRLRNGEEAIYARGYYSLGSAAWHEIILANLVHERISNDGSAFYAQSEFDVVEILGQGEKND